MHYKFISNFFLEVSFTDTDIKLKEKFKTVLLL